MEVMRDLFFEVYASTPDEFKGFTSDDKNNLSFVTQAARIGAFRQIGRIFQELPDSDNNELLNQIVIGLVRASSAPGMRQLLEALTTRDPEHRLFWRLFDQVYDVLEAGDAGKIRQLQMMGLHVLASLGHVEQVWQKRNPGDPGILDLALKGTAEVVQQEHLFLASPTVDFLPQLLSSAPVARFLETLYEETKSEEVSESLGRVLKGFAAQQRMTHGVQVMKAMYEDDSPRNALHLLTERIPIFLESRECKALDLERLFESFLELLEERNLSPSTAYLQKSAFTKLRTSFSSALKDGSLDRVLWLAKDDPEQFKKMLRVLNQYLGSNHRGEIKDFVDLVLRGLSESP
jgi:hypothetical protein